MNYQSSRATAVALAADANRTIDYGPAKGALWEAALFYDHPRAIARVEGVVYCYQKRGLYYPLSDADAAEAVTFK